MYPVSQAFIDAVQSNTRKYYWTGSIVTKNKKEYAFGNEDIVKGSGYVTRQCCGNGEIELGTVYAAEMGITLFSDIDRYTLEGGEIRIYFHLLLADGSSETVPMGIFEISEANRHIKTLELKAYDYMLRFEKNFNGFETIGTAYDFLALCCKACDVELAQTQEQILAFPNAAATLAIYPENDIETYRDVLYYTAQVLGCFCCINREGKLELRKYGVSPVLQIGSRHRFSSSFSDFITRYTAVSSTNLRTQTAEYYALETDDGLTMNLGVNPLLQFGLEETRKQLCENILQDLSNVAYVPFDSDTIGNPALDLGDVLTFTGGQADETQHTCITAIQYKIGGKQSLKCVGKNPRLAQAKSKHDKNLSGLLTQIEAGRIGIHTFTNASSFSVADTNVRIISIEFAASEETHVQFFAGIVIDVAAEQIERTATAKGTITVPDNSVPQPEDGAVASAASAALNHAATLDDLNRAVTSDALNRATASAAEITVELPVVWQEDGMADAYITYELNDEEIRIFHPQESWHSGKHTLTLYYPIEEIIADYTNTFNVYLRMTKGTGTIGAGNCIASISGQSMAAAPAWDGKITVEEAAASFLIGGGIGIKTFADAIYTETMELVQRSCADSIHRVGIEAFCRPVE